MKRGTKPRPIADRFWEKVKMAGAADCWEWGAYVNQFGYGIFEKRVAHRWAFELAGGVVPDGLELDHLCRNRACVNPSHLEPVTRSENMRRSPYFWKTHCVHGHALEGDNLYVEPDGHRQCRTCRREAMARFLAETDPEPE